MFVLCAVLINRLGHGSTSEITHIIPEPYPQLEYHTVAWLWNIWFPSGMKRPCKGEEWHLENREELSIRLARFYPPSILPSNRRTCSQVETEGWWLTSQLRLLSPEEWTRLQDRLKELRSRGCSLPQSLPQGLPLMWAEIQVWSGHTAGAARMAFPHSYQLFQASSTWRCMFVWKK